MKNKVLQGRVVSAKQPKTVTVLIERKYLHPLYGKAMVRSKKFLADDCLGVSEGDVVEIMPVRPLSKNKYFKVVKVLGRDVVTLAREELKEATTKEIAEVMSVEEDKVTKEENK